MTHRGSSAALVDIARAVARSGVENVNSKFPVGSYAACLRMDAPLKTARTRQVMAGGATQISVPCKGESAVPGSTFA
jgi:hypothetical protein